MSEAVNVQAIVQQAIEEYMRQDMTRKEPAHKAELHEERRRREQLDDHRDGRAVRHRWLQICAGSREIDAFRRSRSLGEGR